MPTARFEADFSGFISAINASQIAMVNFNRGAENVEATLNDMTDKFSGRALIQEASLMTIAVEKIGGVSKLTADELEQVGIKANDAVDKLRQMGSDVPAGLQKLADATKANADASDEWSGALKLLQTGLSAIGVTASMTAVINWLKSIGTEASELTNMAARLQTTTSEVQKFQVAAEATGVPMSTMVSAMQTLQEKIGKGNDAGLNKAFADLHLSMDQMKDQSLFTNLTQISTALQGISDKNKEAAAAQDIFGRGWKELLPVINSNLAETTNKVTEMNTSTVAWFDQMKTHSAETQTSWSNTAANIIHNIGSLTPVANALKDSLAGMALPKLPPLFESGKIPAVTKDLDALVQAGNDMTAAIGSSAEWVKWKQAVADVDAQMTDFHTTLDGLDGAVVESAESMLKLGMNAKDVQNYFLLTDQQMKALQADMKEWTAVQAAFAAADAAAEDWHTTLDGLSGTVVEATKYYLSLGLSVQQVSAIMQESVKDMQAVKNGMAESANATNQLQKAQADYNDYLAKTTEDATTYQINKLWEKVAAEEAAFKGSEDQRAEYNKVVEALADAQTEAIVAAAYKAEDGTAQALNQTVDDYRQAAATIQTFRFTPGSQSEQQAMSAALAEVNATNVGRMIQQGTQSVDLMNQYEALIEAAMARQGFSVGGGLTPAAQAAGYGSNVTTTVNVNGSVLSTSSQIASAVNAALTDAMRRNGLTVPSQ